MGLRAYVLHLLRAEKRRANARHLLDSCGLEGQIWPAVDGAAMSSSDLDTVYGGDLFAPRYPFRLRTGEIGCFLSHRQIWAEMQSRPEEAALILEDDAGLEPGRFATALGLAARHVQRLGYIQLQTRPPKSPSQLIDKSGDCALVIPDEAGLRTTAQLVSRAAAARLLALSETFDRPVDTFVQSHWHTGLRPAAIHPSGVLEIAHRLDGSTIQTAQKPLLDKLRREVQRACYRARVRRMSARSDAPRQTQATGND